MHRALYRKWRPLTFSDVVGQEHITKILMNEVDKGRTSHAYLFCGSRGTGKTTCAKILAKAVNCEAPLSGNPCGKCPSCISIENGTATDVLEMDAASNTGVDYIRDIKSEVMYSPSMLKNRVYIIDEVHMLSDSAFNALLKTLEEPPEKVVFILATTEKQKVPATILSRCQKFDFRRIPTPIIAKRLEYIANSENIRLDGEAAHLIGRLSQGGMRDAISLLELCSSQGGNISAETVRIASGVVSGEICTRTIKAIAEKDGAEIFEIVSEIYYSSSDISAYWTELMSSFRDMLVLKTLRDRKDDRSIREMLDLTENEFESLSGLSARFGSADIIAMTGILEKAYTDSIGRPGNDKRMTAELTLLKLFDPSVSITADSLSARISSLENRLMSGQINTLSPVSSSSGKAKKENKKSAGVKNNENKPECPENDDRPPEKKASPALGAIPGFAEIVGIYGKTNSSSLPFLSSAAASIDGNGNVTLTVSSVVAKMMLTNDKAEQTLGAIMRSKGIEVSSFTIVVGEKDASSAENDGVFG